MAGIYRGMVDDGKALLANSSADLWVVQRDTLGPTLTIQPARRCLSRLARPAGGGARRQRHLPDHAGAPGERTCG